jgi:hypothetical protein
MRERVILKSSDVEYVQWMAYLEGRRTAPVAHSGRWYRPVSQRRLPGTHGSGQTDLFEFMAEPVAAPASG